MSSRSLTELRPQFADPVIKWLGECARVGLDVLVYCTFRSMAEQNEIYKIGRTVKGANATARKPMGDTVTNARGGESAHNYGLALDFVPLLAGKPQWDKRSPLWAQAIRIAEKYGLESLANNPRFSEQAHLQMPRWRDHIGEAA